MEKLFIAFCGIAFPILQIELFYVSFFLSVRWKLNISIEFSNS